MGDGLGDTEGAGERLLRLTNRKQPQAKDCPISSQVEGKKVPILAFADPMPNTMPVIQARVPLQGVGEILQSISG